MTKMTSYAELLRECDSFALSLSSVRYTASFKVLGIPGIDSLGSVLERLLASIHLQPLHSHPDPALRPCPKTPPAPPLPSDFLPSSAPTKPKPLSLGSPRQGKKFICILRLKGWGGIYSPPPHTRVLTENVAREEGVTLFLLP